MWPFERQRKQLARTTLNDVPVSVARDEHDGADKKRSNQVPAIEKWQELVLKYADRIPIVSSACNYYNDATQRVTYDIIDATTGDAIDDANAKILANVLNENPEDMGRAVELLFLIGEARQTYNSEQGLKTHGAGELTRRGQKFVMIDDKGKSTELDENTRAWRTHKPDRKWSDKATSSHKSMLDLLEAFVIAYAEERAVSIRQAMNAGGVVISEDLLTDTEVETGDPGEQIGPDGRQRLERRFEQMLSMTIKNPRNAASFQPTVFVAPREVQDVSKLVAHVPFAAERDKRKIQERLDGLKREYAVGTDLPADVAAGFLADLNHWNARSVDENAWKNYLAPKIQLVANNVFEELAEGLGIDVSGWMVVPNGSQLVEKTVQGDNAKTAWDRGLISDDAARKAWGFGEDDKAGVTDGPEFPVGSQEPISRDPGMTRTVRPRSFAADIDRQKLKRMSREVQASTERMREEINEALMDAAGELADDSLTAAGDPVDNLRDNIVRSIMANKADMGAAAARALATKRANEWFDTHYPQLSKRADKAASHAKQLLMRQVKAGTFHAGFARDLVRSVESIAAGGAKNVKANGDVNNIRPALAPEDQDFMRLLNDEIEKLTVKYVWQHGGSANPFPAHLDLDGVEWLQHEEREVLSNDSDFPVSATFYPGDHGGCSCGQDVTYEVVV